MASLELSRSVNDDIQSGDYAGAFAPLQAQSDLHLSEYPTLEKKSLAVLAKALEIPENVQFWANIILDPSPTAHIFAYKTLSRLGEGARPIVEPLHQAILDFWKSQKPADAELADQKGLDGRRVQDTMLSHAMELMMTLDVKRTIEFCCEQIKIQVPLDITHWCAHQIRVRREEEARAALQAELAEVIGDRGVIKTFSLFQMANWVNHDIYWQARNQPHVKELFEAIGEDLRFVNHRYWNRISPFGGAIYALGQSKKEPQKIALQRFHKFLFHHHNIALSPKNDESAQISLAFFHILTTIDYKKRIESAAVLLKESRDFIPSLPVDNPIRHLWVSWARWLFNHIYGGTRTIRYEWKPQDALNLLDVLQLDTEEPTEISPLMAEAKGAYQHALQIAEKTSSDGRNMTTSIIFETRSIEQKLLNTEAISALPSREQGENIFGYFWRVFNEHKARINEIKDLPETRTGQKYEDSEVESKRYKNFILSLNDELSEQERQEVFYGLSLHTERYLASEAMISLYSVWAAQPAIVMRNYQFSKKDTREDGKFGRDDRGEKLLKPIADQLWKNFEEAILNWGREQKLNRANYQPDRPSLVEAQRLISNLRTLVIYLEGCKGYLLVIQAAERLRVKALAEMWENGVLSSLNGLPDLKSLEAWQAQKVDEHMLEFLEYMVQRVPQRSSNDLTRHQLKSSTNLAFPFYRIFTPEARKRCCELVAQSNILHWRLLEVINLASDEETWLGVLSGTPSTDPKFFEIWKKARSDAQNRKRIAVAVLKALPNATSDSGVKMMLEMLGEVDMDEFSSHADLIAQNIESPNPKVTKWSLETLLKLSNVELDWPHTIEIVGEKLWSENAGLSKVAAKFLGTVPLEHAEIAWGKLVEALEMENLALVEATVRAMAVLKGKNSALKMESGAEKLESLAQLAPERFGKLAKRLADG